MSTAVALATEQNNVPAIQTRRPPEIRVVNDPIAVLDTARFEQMQRIASVMAHSSLIPESLYIFKNEHGEAENLPIERVTANCFLVVNQAVRWNSDPFAVAQCVSVVHGKLCYEGKLLAAVLEGKLGIDLEYEITGAGESMKVVVSGAVNGKVITNSKGTPKTVEGTVAEWKTTGKGSPWLSPGGYVRMLRYRGAREWSRVYSPGMMLGVYSDDELEDMNTSQRAAAARVVRDEPPTPPTAQIEAKPAEPIVEVPVSGSVEQLVEAGHAAPAETVEWTEPKEDQPAQVETPAQDDPPTPPEPEEEKPVEQPPVPPQAAMVTVGLTEHPGSKTIDVTVVDDFPGDKPMPKANDDGLDIPPMLRRTSDNKPAHQKDEEPVNVEEWLKGLGDALTGVEGTEELVEVQAKYQAPMKGKVSKTDWARSQTLVMDAFNRICVADDE